MSFAKKTVAVTALAATGLLSACSAEDTVRTPAAENRPAAERRPVVDKENWPKDTPERGLAKGLSLPLEDYMVSYADTVAVDQAKNKIQKQCMAGYGFDIDFPVPGANPPPSDNDANMERRYGITDRTLAAKHGYGLPEMLTRHTDQPTPDLTDVQVEVLTGRTKPEPVNPPEGTKDADADTLGMPGKTKPARAEYNGKKLREGGCAGWSKQQVDLDEKDSFFVSDLNGNSLLESQRSEPVQTAIREWSSCMKGKGHYVADPYKAMDQGVTPDDKATKETIALALDDIDCKGDTDLVKIWFAEESAIQKKQIAGNKVKLTSVRDNKRGALATASKANGS